MKNKYFHEMQKRGIAYRKCMQLNGMNNQTPLFSKGASIAFKHWSISERYHSTDIFIDEMQDDSTLYEMIITFRDAGIESLVFSFIYRDSLNRLVDLDCRIASECKVYRRETELYYGSLEVLKGIRVFL